MPQSAKLENLQYAASMLRVMRGRMNLAGENLLTYLLDVAYLEALDRIRTVQGEANSSTPVRDIR